jgi:PAS domain S-box-containing protein
MKTENPFHVEVIRKELERRQQHNSRYSLRGFAEFLLLHPSALSRILAGKQPLSVTSALQILKKIEMTEEERLAFATSLAREKLDLMCSQFSTSFGGSMSESVLKNSIVESVLAQAGLPPPAAAGSSSADYHQIVEFLPSPCWLLDRNAKQVETNEGCRAEFGGVEPSLISDLIHEEDLPGYLEQMQRAREVKRAFQTRFRLRDKSGSYSPREVRTVPLKSATNEITGWLCMVVEAPAALQSTASGAD